jgi:hypothetical protein
MSDVTPPAGPREDVLPGRAEPLSAEATRLAESVRDDDTGTRFASARPLSALVGRQLLSTTHE